MRETTSHSYTVIVTIKTQKRLSTYRRVLVYY